MDGEWRSVGSVSASTAAALGYCYLLSGAVSPGRPRLLAVLPVICLFWWLPFSFSTAQLRCVSAFFLAWLATFKLLLFALGRGPLAEANLSLPAFLAVASLPVKIRHGEPKQPQSSGRHTSLLLFALKLALFALLVSFYPQRRRYPRYRLVLAYGVHVYLSLEALLGLTAFLSRALLGGAVELEAQFAAPYLASSLQDFWGRRWNLMATRVLHPAVYAPVRSRWGTLAGVMAAFVVSGIMHEAMFYYLTLQRPTGEVTCFFLLHGASTAVEVAAKRSLGKRGWRAVPRVVTAPLTLAYVWGTGLLLFFPPLLRGGVAEEAVAEECVTMLEAVRSSVGRGVELLSSLLSFLGRG